MSGKGAERPRSEAASRAESAGPDLAARLIALARERAAELPGQSYGPLARRRAEALELLASRGLPTTREELWRFTPLAALEALPLAAATPGARAPAGAAALGVPGALRAVWVDGFAVQLPDPRQLPAGARVESLRAALARDPERVCARLGQLADEKRSPFTALSTALFEDGLWLELAPGCALEAPLELLFADSGGGRAAQPRLVLALGAGSRATLIERHWGDPSGAGGLCNAVTEIELGPGAELEHVSLQQQGPRSAHLARIAVRQVEASRLGSHSLALGGALSRVEIETSLAGERAHASLRGLYLGGGSQLVDHYTSIEHAAPHTSSDELYKGVLDGRAHGVFHGRIEVRPHAQKTDARQQNRTLLLADGPTINAKPQLEIHADDVRCSHGATVGRLAPDALFYLRSRGLDEREARALLTLGFARELCASLPAPGLPEEIETALERWLAGGAKP